MQILPAIDIRGGQCVRLRQGDYGQETIFGDDPIAMAQKWEAAGGHRIHIVDLDGAKAGKPINLDAIRGIASALSVPIQVGGGIRNDDTVKLLLEECGVDRVIIGTQALKQPEWFSDVVHRYPNRVALGLDARDSMVATEGWLDVSKTSAIELAKQYVGLPIGAVIYTNIANDGMMQGIDEGTIQDMLALAALGLPVIASGGVTTVADITRLAEASLGQPNLVGAITGRALYEGTLTVTEAVEAVKAVKS
ncbi:MAG: 1-(5-phosphoribosyl)-5-[(5-phosphoribosylamino)methylideneamino]imidazole-4-carboxamide isomerase [Planctomycetaceae bacterium]|nr:1-(5-phosphoribosyl)-5-[(5-phosphoribosylamino)methylideneamino]imidazole-4-carboxamide isomerase [Planctomycetaceae bacterium]MCB9949966.1 1-(5-phosphoribosyl)-5-[(5-phosphoribosylamino)methylideneamino]imidazole-4-carboxamide isomerase [Planctomycetaceae bacterium]